MNKTRLTYSIISIFLLIVCTCISPYTPEFKGYDSILVIDGLITDQNTSYKIKLSRTFQNIKSGPVPISNAIVFLTDNLGNSTNFAEEENGIYKSDSLKFTGVIGRKYVLQIFTKEGERYISDTCQLQSVPDIDSIYFDKDQQFIKNETKINEGISIYLDSKTGENNRYYRWDYDETWKFRIPLPPVFTYINESTIIPYTKFIKSLCWKNAVSNSIVVGSDSQEQPGRIIGQPIAFIASDQSDRLLIEYSILIRQYSISKDAYNYLKNLIKVDEPVNQIFATVPYPVTSNIHNTNNSQERILGYFMASAVKQKRKFIPYNDIYKWQLPFYHNPCKEVIADPATYRTTFGGLYKLFCIDNDWIFIEPVYILNGASERLSKLVFVRPECADCELTGTLKKPDFWIDRN
ncbi:MAG: DUF4249 domain-containing protein [Bacteroidetes bacterium]|nr:MAG: DUF4249 domain-containing protein [Bacteroidota bacterium]